MTNHTEVTVDELPPCDLDPSHGDAHYDARMRGRSSWAYMCSACFDEYSVGLGLGVGQRLVKREAEAPKPAPWTVGALLADMSTHPARRREP
jgi:hypothetical protein